MATFKVSKECLDAAGDALSRFSDAELSQYVKDVYTRAREYPNIGSTAAIQKAQKEINDETLAMLFNDSKTKLDNIGKVDKAIKDIKGGASLRELLIKRYKQLGNNVAVFKKAAKQKLDEISFRAMSTEDWDFLRDKNNDNDVANALDGKSSSDAAKRIAKQAENYRTARTDGMVNSGALPLEFINDDRFFRHIHDRSRMMAAGRSLADAAKSIFKKYDSSLGKPLWRNFIKAELDLEKTFRHTDAMGLDGKIIDSEVDNILDNIFDNIISGNNDIFSRSKVVNGKEEIMKRRRMFFNFKNWDSFNRYNTKYGTGDLYSAWMSDIHGSANKIGISNMLGSNVHQAYFDLKKAQLEADPTKGKLWFRNTDLYFNTVMGVDQSPVSPTLANFFGNLRSFSSMAALPLVGIKSTTDVAYIASFAARWGMDYWNSFGYLVKNSFDRFKPEDRKYIAKLFHGMIHSEMGYIGRFIDNHDSSELIKKANTAYYRGVGLNALDTGNKVGILHLMADHLGKSSGRDYNALSDAMKQQFIKHGITPNEWNVLRTKTQKGLFTTDNATNLTDSEIRGIYEKSDKSVPLHRLRENIFTKVYSIFDVASENSVLQPGEFEKAWLYQGHPPGTILGELLRCYGQFKAYPIAYVDRVLVNGFKDAQGSRARIAWALQMTLATLPLSVASNYLSYLGQGLSYPDVTQMSPSEATSFGLENILGNLGVFLNITNAQNQNKGLISSQLRTPSLQLLSDSLAIPLAAVTGHGKAAATAFKDASSHILPLTTLPILSPYMMGMLNQKPYLAPHQHILYGYNK